MKPINVIGLLSTVSLLAVSAPVLAQENSEKTANKYVDEIVVTARKRSESLLDVPLAVSVIGQAQLVRDQVQSLTDLSRTTPALEVSPTFGGEQNGGGRVRGVGTFVSNKSVSPSVAFQVDQVPQGNISFPQLFDLQQVEVLRGPQGTLFGQGASAGVVNVTTAQPSLDGVSGRVGVEYAGLGDAGSESGKTIVGGAVNVPLNETMALRVSGQYRKDTGVQYNVTLGDHNEQNNYGVRAQLLWEMAPNITNVSKAEYSFVDRNGRDFFSFDNVNPPAGAPVTAPSLGNIAACGVTLGDYAGEYCSDQFWTSDTESFNLSNVLEYDMGAVTLTAVTAYRSLTDEFTGANFSTRSLGPAARSENQLEKSSQFSQELRLSYSNDKFDVVAGGLYSTYDFELSPLIDGAYGQTGAGERIGFSVCTPDGGFCVVPVTFVSEVVDGSTLAAFADATYSVNDQVNIFGGIRISDFSSEVDIGTPNANTIAQTSETGETNVSGRLGARYQPNDNTTLYASIATGYKPSALVVDPVLDTVFLNEEKSLAIEAGAKYDLGSTTLELNVFRTKLDDFQAQTSVLVEAELISKALNIEEVISKGIEVTAYGNIGEYLNYNAGYLFNDVRYPDGFLGDDGTDFTDQQLSLAPKHKFTVSGEFYQPVSQSLEGFINLNAVYKSKVLLAARDPERFSYDGHVTVGGSIGIRDDDGRWTASIYARNLFKEREPIGYLASTMFGQSDGGIRSWPAAGITTRLIGAKVDVNF